ncbi:MAG: SURF1 family protein [Aquimonas sp.]|nr:SURF1 family protein [Aquimonas sp.]
MSARARLRFGLLVTFGLACALSFGALSAWQWGRGEQKAAWLMAAESARAAPPQPIAQRLSQPPSDYAEPVAGRVEVVTMPRLLLDNQQREGRVGLREYVLVETAPNAPLLLAEFGWLPLPLDRSLPELPPLPSGFDARGVLTPLPGQGLRLAANPPIEGAAVLLMYLDTEELGAALGRTVLPRLLRLDPEVDVGHTRDLDVLPNTLPPEKHRGYALQWAGLSAAALVITLILSFRSRR